MVVQLDYIDVIGQRYNPGACFREQTFKIFIARLTAALFFARLS
jgi:hypothetical protein